MSERARVEFGQKVKEAREELGMTQEQLAEKAGVHQAYVSHIERGTYNTRIDTMAAIAVALNLTLTISLE